MQNYMFYLAACPYCKRARAHIEGLAAGDERLAAAAASFRWVEESRESDFARGFDYYYVPCAYVDGRKLHEGVMSGGQAKELLEAVAKKLEEGRGA